MESISFVYSLPYILLLCFFLVLALCENRIGRRYSRIISLLVFMVFFGGRGYIGWDWTSYLEIFDNFPTLFDSSFFHDLLFETPEDNYAMEKGFLIYLSFIKTLGFNYLMFVLISVVIDAILTDKFIEHFCPNYALAMLLFIYVYCNAEINLQRNIKSITLFLFSLQYAEQRKMVKFMLINLLGFSFHFSAIFYILSYFLFRIPVNKWVYIVIIILFNGIYLLQINLIQNIIPIIATLIGGKAEIAAEVYTNSIMTHEAGISIGALERLITSFMVFVFWNDLNEQKERGRIFINSFIAYLLCIDIFWPFSIFIERIALLFMFCYVYIWSTIVRCIELKQIRYICLGCLIFYSSMRFGLKYNSIFCKYDNFLTLIYDDENVRKGIFYRYKFQQQQ